MCFGCMKLVSGGGKKSIQAPGKKVVAYTPEITVINMPKRRNCASRALFPKQDEAALSNNLHTPI